MSALLEKHAIISGGGSGVGAIIADELAQSGCKVTILGRTTKKLEKVAKGSANINWQICDVTDRKAVDAAYDAAQSDFGGIDFVIANAGMADSQPFEKIAPEEFNEALAVNLTGVFNCWQSALMSMRAQEYGRLIAIASTAGLKGYPYVSSYCAAKHGVIGLTKALALELAKTKITVNAICPGFVKTPLLDASIEKIMKTTKMNQNDAENALKSNNPQGRFIECEEIASNIKYLCSPQTRSITGQALAISGGEI